MILGRQRMEIPVSKLEPEFQHLKAGTGAELDFAVLQFMVLAV